MNVVIIDDEIPAIEELKYYLKDYEIQIVGTYSNPITALDNLLQDKPDIIFLDIDMPRMNGIVLAASIKNVCQDIIIVFVTAYTQYALESFRVHPIDYLLKPIDPKSFETAMKRVMKQYQLIKNYANQSIQTKKDEKVVINCFGKFEILKNRTEVMKFTTKKSKELMAYLICKADKPVYRDEMLRTLFIGSDSERASNNFYVSLHRLRVTMERFGIENEKCHIKDNNSLFIADGVCNYIDFCRFVKNNRTISENNIKIGECIVQQYHGDLFEDIDSDWANEAREWMDIQIESIILKMASYYFENQRLANAESILQHLIEINPLSNLGLEMLLDLFIYMGNKHGYRFLYRKYETLMIEDLNLDIAKKYKDYNITISKH